METLYIRHGIMRDHELIDWPLNIDIDPDWSYE
jgi:hypothetical protein